jgi:exopolyphosphatase/pppGpp-phosphohydrolase
MVEPNNDNASYVSTEISSDDENGDDAYILDNNKNSQQSRLLDDPSIFTRQADAAEDVFRTLATENHQQRILNPGLSEDRNDIIVAGCCILVATMRRLHIDEIIVSTRNLLDGVTERGGPRS